MAAKRPSSNPDGPKYRVSNIELRCARCIGPFLFVRGAITVSVLKDGDKDEAMNFAVDTCHSLLDRMQLKETQALPLPSEAQPEERVANEDDEIPF